MHSTLNGLYLWFISRRKNKHIYDCVDFSTGLNECLKTYEYPLPNAKDIFAKLNGVKIFSKLDLSEVYLQVMANEETLKLLMINTRRGLYSFNHLLFRYKVAPSIFQKLNIWEAQTICERDILKKLVNLVSDTAWINANFTCQKWNIWGKLLTRKVKDLTWKDLVQFRICPSLTKLQNYKCFGALQTIIKCIWIKCMICMPH